MSLRGFILKRVVYTFVLVLFVIVMNWVIFQAVPGVQGAISALQGNPRSTSKQYEYYENLYGLNKPPLERFLNYFWGMLTFNFGNSFNTQHPGQRVDYIFTHGVDAKAVRSAWIETDRLAKYASDHFPIGAEIEI